MKPRKRPRFDSRNLGTIDMDTGEVTLGVTVQFPLKYRVGDHIAVMQEAALAIALDPDMTLVPMRVLKYLEAQLDYENAIRVVQQDVAKKLDLDRSQVNRAFKMLLAKGIVEKVNAPSLKAVYRLNPNYGWRGRHSNWDRERRGATPLRLLAGGRAQPTVAEKVEIAIAAGAKPTAEQIAIVTGAPTLIDA